MLDPGPLAADGYRCVVPNRVMDPTGNNLSSHNGRHHHPKQRETRSEILGAVHRVDQEGKVRVFQPVQQRRVMLRGLLTDQDSMWKDLPQPLGDHPLGGLVRVRHKVHGRRLLPNLLGRQIPEAGHDLNPRGFAEKLIHSSGITG
jgi:hypothetical protein